MAYYFSKDGSKISYKVFGKGPALLLVHGMGNRKELWEETGWIDLLKDFFTVITIDIRGNGQSDKSYEVDFYDYSKILEDIDTLITKLGFTEFNCFGHSYGATIGLQLCKYNKKLNKCICAGTTFGDKFFKEVIPMWIKKYEKYEYMKKNNKFDTKELSKKDIDWIKNTDLNLNISQMKAWINWDGINPSDINCKLTIYSGSNDNPIVLENIKENIDSIKTYGVKYKIFDNLNHLELVSKIDIVSPFVLDFLVNN